MSDLVKRLRKTLAEMAAMCSVDMGLWDKHSNAVLEAADAIEAYEAALKWIDDHEPATQEMTLAHDMAQIARAALEKHNG
jgi:hypothetical protein